MSLICLLLLLGCLYSQGYGYDCNNPYVSDSGPLVKTSSGSLVGKYIKVFDYDVAAFLGIPYAEPPVNEKRFLKPCPLERWEGILDATTKPKPCMQYSTRNFSWIPTSTPSEDCLYLNIWTPAKCCCSPSDRLPVMVWIYGGGFYSGSSDMNAYDGSTIASCGRAIVVSVNYRVGIFGFLKTGSKEAPGNVGLLDQNVALKWIKKNIENFGGNPNRITIMGQSAGSWSVSLHMISPMSRNLFNAAILQSGSAYHPLLVDSPTAAYVKANVFAKLIGCVSDNSSIDSDSEVFQCINKKSSEELARFEDTFTSKVPQYFLPTYGDEFLPSPPIKVINEGHIAPVNILTGTTKNEATIFLNYIVPTLFNLDSPPLVTLETAPAILAGLFSIVPRPSVSEIHEYYFRNISEAGPRAVTKIIADAFGDFVFHCPTQFFAEKAKSAFYYWMTHRSSKDPTDEWVGVPHFYEIPFVFGAPRHDSSTYSAEDASFSSNLINKWITFAETGHPLGYGNPEYWPQFTAEGHLSYDLNPRQEGILIYPRAEACEFWRPFFKDIPASTKDC